MATFFRGTSAGYAGQRGAAGHRNKRGHGLRTVMAGARAYLGADRDLPLAWKLPPAPSIESDQ